MKFSFCLHVTYLCITFVNVIDIIYTIGAYKYRSSHEKQIKFKNHIAGHI